VHREEYDTLPYAYFTDAPALEVVLQGLHESEIHCGIRNEPPAGGITAWIDFGGRTEKATFYGTIVGDREVWPAADRIAAWMHETALRLFPDIMPKRTAVDRGKARRSEALQGAGRPKESPSDRSQMGLVASLGTPLQVGEATEC
jgi:hypothetical protein